MDVLLQRLCELTFVRPNWVGTDGQTRQVPEETLKKILNILHIDTSSSEAISHEIRRLEEEYWQEALPHAPIIRIHHDHYSTPIEMIAFAQDTHSDHHIIIELEHGGKCEFTFKPAEQHILEQRLIHQQEKVRYNFYFPNDLPLSYHRLIYRFGTYSLIKTLIVAPMQSYIPDDFWQQKKWGIGTHIYGLRDEIPTHIGDFSHLDQLVDWAKEEGASFVGINPLHTLYIHHPEIAAPYSPSSRLWLNPIYAVIWQEDEQEAEQESPTIDYTVAYQHKIKALRKSFEGFCNNKEDFAAFNIWVAKEGKELHNFALFSALSLFFKGEQPHLWPKGYQNPTSDTSRSFAKTHAREILFHCWLQYVCHNQLSYITEKAKNLGIGLYGDLAVGTTSFGADSWSAPETILRNVHFGAPPDSFSPTGQNWGICPFNPLTHVKKALKPLLPWCKKTCNITVPCALTM